MRRASWKNKRGSSVKDAMRLCTQYAHVTQNLSVERIAELMGLDGTSTLYRWLAEGRMPANQIRNFENVCDCNYLTRYIALSAGLFAFEIPNGRKAQHRELNDLSLFAHQVFGQLLEFFDGVEDEEPVVQAISVLIEDLALQRANVEKHHQPELLEGVK